ncbi:MAG: hypothetical protein EBZ48_14255 [Proteobacteria bacterium]|nr:hypothetical protein [Pseudomonadota bacterium]
MLRIKNVTLEAPDLGGKTTLCGNIHRATGFRWSITDRSLLSDICYTRQFGRGEDRAANFRSDLRRWLLDLNNSLIVLLPPVQVLEQRYLLRGDEVQDIESLRVLHRIYEEEVSRIAPAGFQPPPNVLVIREPLSPEDLTEKCVSWLTSREAQSPIEVASQVEVLAASSPSREAVGCRFVFSPDPRSLEPGVSLSSHMTSPSVMQWPPEEAYYAKILSHVMQNIEDEIAGRNEYSRKQDVYTTRRFIYTQDSCISLIHTTLRRDTLTMRVYCRSSDVKSTFKHDFQFICYLFSRVYARFRDRCGWSGTPRGNFVIDVEIGSAHIP